MQFAYVIFPKETLIVQRISGDVTSEAHINALSGMRADPLYREGMNVLVDLRGEVRSRRMANEVLNEVLSLRRHGARLMRRFGFFAGAAGVRHALLVGSGPGSSVEAQMYENLARAAPDLLVRRFEEPEQAVRWLRLRRAPAFYLDKLPKA